LRHWLRPVRMQGLVVSTSVGVRTADIGAESLCSGVAKIAQVASAWRSLGWACSRDGSWVRRKMLLAVGIIPLADCRTLLHQRYRTL